MGAAAPSLCVTPEYPEGKPVKPWGHPVPQSAYGSSVMSDNWNFNASNPCLHVGGNYNQNGNHGMFHVNQNNASNANGNISAAPFYQSS